MCTTCRVFLSLLFARSLLGLIAALGLPQTTGFVAGWVSAAAQTQENPSQSIGDPPLPLLKFSTTKEKFRLISGEDWAAQLTSVCTDPDLGICTAEGAHKYPPHFTIVIDKLLESIKEMVNLKVCRVSSSALFNCHAPALYLQIQRLQEAGVNSKCACSAEPRFKCCPIHLPASDLVPFSEEKVEEASVQYSRKILMARYQQ